MTNIARYGEQVKVPVWNVRETGRGLRNGINYLMPFALKPETWPYKELNHPETELMLPVLLRAERAYGSGVYGKAAAMLPVTTLNTQEIIAYAKALNTPQPTTMNSVDRLIWPVK